MFSFLRKKMAFRGRAIESVDEEAVELVQSETAAERRERVAQELCDNPEFAMRFDRAVKIIYGDRAMMMQCSSIPSDRKMECTYADSRRALLAMATPSGGQDEDFRASIAASVQIILSQGRKFHTREDVEKAFQDYQSR